ncbi:MAG TPA: hypothetical protein VGO58_16305 [Chitinophagaceae bacterium]|nr:hypothetical protein [Chitinophagaceae bacterium]
MNGTDIIEKSIRFLDETGIAVRFGVVEDGSFLPGLSIERGCIIVDKEKLKYPGDILHEAGHLAIVPAADRTQLDANLIAERPQRKAEEMMAIAWSYAAAIYLSIDPHIIFHDDGYKGGGSYIADSFANKQYFGLPMLQWVGMAADEKKAKELNINPYPEMIKWLRD